MLNGGLECGRVILAPSCLKHERNQSHHSVSTWSPMSLSISNQTQNQITGRINLSYAVLAIKLAAPGIEPDHIALHSAVPLDA